MKHLLIALILSCAGMMQAADIYISQGGLSPNTNSIAWFNDAANWTSGAGKINGGTTVHFTGTITNGAILQGNGSAGNNITLLFDPGAQFARPFWGPSKFDAAMSTPNGVAVSYITIDGGSNGLITSTDNGEGKTFETNSYGIEIVVSANVEVKNMVVSNLYWRTFGTNCPGTDVGQEGINVGGSSTTNILVHNNKVHYVLNGIQVGYGGAYSTNFQVYSNDVEHINQGINISMSGTSGDMYGFAVWANRIDHFEDFDPGASPCAGSWHSDGIFINENPVAAPTNHNMRIYRNYIGPSVINSSGLINLTPGNTAFGYPGLLVYNNLLIEGTNTVHVNNIIGSAIGCGSVYAYNTLISLNAGNAIGAESNQTWKANVAYNFGLNSSVQVDQWFVTNSINDYAGYLAAGYILVVSNPPSNFIYGQSPSTAAITFDQNAYSSTNWTPGELFSLYLPGASTFVKDWDTWRNFGFDPNSTTNSVILNSDYSISTNSPVGLSSGTNLTALGITEDFNGNPRPSTGNWTLGAFQVAGSFSPPPTSGSHLHILNANTLQTR